MSNLRKEFEKLIEKKKAEIEDLRRSIAAAEAYIQAMNDALKKVPKDEAPGTPSVRPGSDVDLIREVIVKAGRPLHLGEIIAALGREDNADNKSKIAGTLGWYIGKGRVFEKTAPNTYGLIEVPPPDLPPEFGAGD